MVIFRCKSKQRYDYKVVEKNVEKVHLGPGGRRKTRAGTGCRLNDKSTKSHEVLQRVATDVSQHADVSSVRSNVVDAIRIDYSR
jgi:hypothetical protein